MAKILAHIDSEFRKMTMLTEMPLVRTCYVWYLHDNPGEQQPLQISSFDIDVHASHAALASAVTQRWPRDCLQQHAGAEFWCSVHPLQDHELVIHLHRASKPCSSSCRDYQMPVQHDPPSMSKEASSSIMKAAGHTWHRAVGSNSREPQ